MSRFTDIVTIRYKDMKYRSHIFIAIISLVIGVVISYLYFEESYDKKIEESLAQIGEFEDTYRISMPVSRMSILMDSITKIEKEKYSEFYRKSCFEIKLIHESLSIPVNRKKLVEREVEIFNRAKELIKEYEAKGLCSFKE